MKFPIAIEPGTENTAFGVVVPDLPGCFRAGDTVKEVFDNAREAIEAHCKLLAEQGLSIPAPKPMAEWQADPEYKGWTWDIVDVPVEKFFSRDIATNENDTKSESTWVDPDDVPELTGNEIFDPATEWRIGGERVSAKEGRAAFKEALRSHSKESLGESPDHHKQHSRC